MSSLRLFGSFDPSSGNALRTRPFPTHTIRFGLERGLQNENSLCQTDLDDAPVRRICDNSACSGRCAEHNRAHRHKPVAAHSTKHAEHLADEQNDTNTGAGEAGAGQAETQNQGGEENDGIAKQHFGNQRGASVASPGESAQRCYQFGNSKRAADGQRATNSARRRRWRFAKSEFKSPASPLVRVSVVSAAEAPRLRPRILSNETAASYRPAPMRTPWMCRVSPVSASCLYNRSSPADRG